MARRKDVSEALKGLVGEPGPQAERAAEEGPARAEPAQDYTRSISVGLKQSEIATLDDIAAQERVKRNAVMAFFLRWAIKQYRAGELEIPTETERVTKIKMP